MKVEIDIDDLDELRERVSSLEHDLSQQIYKGNSIGYIYDKMTAYSHQAGMFASVIREAVKDGRLVLRPHVEEESNVQVLLDI